jgi:hypothetical protein
MAIVKGRAENKSYAETILGIRELTLVLCSSIFTFFSA